MKSTQPSEVLAQPIRMKQRYYDRFGKLLLSSIPIGLLVCFLVSAIITYITPKIYESTAVIQVAAKNNNSEKIGNAVSFFINEFQSQHQDEIEESLANSLQLSSRWEMNNDDVIKKIHQSISFTPIKNTELIIISVKMIGPVDARDVANRYYEGCKHYDLTDVEAQELEGKVKDQTKVVHELKQKIEDLKKTPAETPLAPEV